MFSSGALLLTVVLAVWCALLGTAMAPPSPRGGELSTRAVTGFALLAAVIPVSFMLGGGFWGAALILAAVSAWGLKGFSVNLYPSRWSSAMWAAVFANLLLLVYGVWAHPGLGDHDPYAHAMGTLYALNADTAFAGADFFGMMPTLDPYPPGYDTCAAFISRISGGVDSGLRIWSVLAASAFPLAVRFFARSWGFSRKEANIAGILSVFLPPTATHFAWTHTPGFVLGVVSAGLAMQAAGDKRWVPAAGAGLGGFLLTATSDLLMAAPLFIPPLVKAVRNRNFSSAAVVLAAGILLSAPWWDHAFQRSAQSGSSLVDSAASGYYRDVRGAFDEGEKKDPARFLHQKGNARVYGWGEFLAPGMVNYFNTPVGLPAAATVLGLWGLGIMARRGWWPVVLALLYLLLTHGERLPWQFFPHRGWSYLALFAALGTAVAGSRLLRDLHVVKGGSFLLAVLAAVSLLHSGAVRVRMESLQWGNEVFLNPGQREGFYGMGEYISGHETFPVAGGGRYGYVAAFGGVSRFWEPEERKAEELFILGRGTEAVRILRDAGYRYLVLDSTLNLRIKVGEDRDIYRELEKLPYLKPVEVKAGFALFRFM